MTATTETTSLEMSLDQLIKNNKESRRGGGRGGRAWSNRHRGGYHGGGPVRNRPMKWGMLRPFRPSPKFIPRQDHLHHQGVWPHDIDKVAEILPPFLRPPTLGIETGTKLYISNLDYGVSTDDIQELFSEVGDVKRCSINYDPSGRSKGTAEVVYSRKIDGVAALKRYNNVQLDGKAMKIEFIGNNNLIGLPNPAPNPAAFGMGRGRRWWGGYRGRRGGRGRRRGFRGGRPAAVANTKSAAELDAELDTYHKTSAMETS